MSLSAGRFLVPRCYKGNPYVAKFVGLFELVAERLGARVLHCDDTSAQELPDDCPFVVVLKPVQWNRSAGFRGLLSLPRRVQVFGLWDDIHQGRTGTKRLSRDRWVLTRFFRRCDAILCTSFGPFVQWYPRYAHKLVHFPHFFQMDDFGPVPFNSAPVAKCILSGAMNAFYPFRVAAARNPDVVVMPHPGYSEMTSASTSAAFGSSYARELAQYRSAVTCSSVLEYVVAKYMELPAAGCLLLATYAPDLDRLGYRDGVNYVRVDERTFDGILADVLARPEAFEPIRRAGFELARARHSDLNRADELERLIRERCATSTR